MERVIPLSRRKGDIVVLVYFWINILLIPYIVDVEQIVLPDISGDWEYFEAYVAGPWVKPVNRRFN